MEFTKFLDPKNDIAFKVIFGSEKNKDILIHFLNDILELNSSGEIIEVTFLSPIQDPEIISKKQSIVDILCKDDEGTQYIVEMQVSPTEGFEKRAQYYASKAYCRQMNKGQEEDGKYSNLKEIIFIAIAGCVLFPEKAEYISRHVILDKETNERDLKDFSFTFIELPKFKKTKVEELETITEKWCYFFKYAAKTEKEDLEKIIKGANVIARAYEALDQFNWTEEELMAYEQEQKRVWDNRAVEEYKIKQAQKEAKAEGIEEGMEKGIEKGRVEGMEKGIIQVAINMLKQNYDIKQVAQMTGLSIDELNKIKASN